MINFWMYLTDTKIGGKRYNELSHQDRARNRGLKFVFTFIQNIFPAG